MTYFVDTGILLRLLDRKDAQHHDVRRAVRALKKRGEQLVTSPQNIAEFWNVSTRPKAARGGLGLSLVEADRRTRTLERLFGILLDGPGTYAEWRRLIVAHGVMGVQVHDARLVALARVHGLSHILTLNAADFARYPNLMPVMPQQVSAGSTP